MTGRAGPRKEAMLVGQKRYSTGIPCKRGHVAERFVATATCVICSDDARQAWLDSGGKTVANASRKRSNAERPDRVKAWRRKHYEANQATYYAAAVERKLAKRKRTPAWADRDAIVKIYAQARSMRGRGESVVVDHIIPLRGRTVSGLHVHTNLQIMERRANAAKSNSFQEAFL